MDIVSKIIDFEAGNMSIPEVVEFFQHLKDTGVINGLQGHYHRVLAYLIEQELVS
jgi:hypothetical protein